MSGGRRRWQGGIAGVVMVVCSACGGVGAAGGPTPGASLDLSPLLSTGWSPPEGQRCIVSGNPPPLPVDALLDTAAAGPVLEAGIPLGSYATLELRFDSLGAPTGVRLVEGSASAPGDGLQALLHDVPVRRPSIGAARSSTYLLRVTGGSPLGLIVGASEECPPTLANRALMPRLVQAEIDRAVKAETILPGGRRQVGLRFFVEEDGTVSRSDVRESSGFPTVDRLALQASRHVVFHPAQLNRRPVAVWVSLKLDMNLPRTSGGRVEVASPAQVGRVEVASPAQPGRVEVQALAHPGQREVLAPAQVVAGP